MNKKINKTITGFLVVSFSFTFFPSISFAQVTEGAPRAIIVNEEDVNTFQQGLTPGQSSQAIGTTGAGRQGGLSGAATGGASCLTASGASQAIQNYVSTQVGGILDSMTETPVSDGKQRAKDTGIALLPSWDSIGYCLVNSVIEYIGTATVQWINSGFNGNPVFVENPEQFFADIADIEAGNFLNELSGGYACSALRSPVRINLANYYNSKISNFNERARCSFTNVSGSLESFMSGETFSWDDWMSYNQSQNNPLGATISARIELDNRIASKLNTESTLLDWGRGFLSPRDPNTNKIKSPGSVVEEQINKRLGRTEDRLQMADEFDEIVSALVNQLVKIAVSEFREAAN
jgi:hypothetical protein